MKILFYSILSLFILSITTFILMFHPVDNSRDNSIEVIGKVVQVYEGGVKDLCFYLESDSSCYYINRGLENGLDLSKIKSQLLNKQVKIYYANYWSLFNVAELSKHINQLEYKDSIIYTEW